MLNILLDLTGRVVLTPATVNLLFAQKPNATPLHCLGCVPMLSTHSKALQGKEGGIRETNTLRAVLASIRLLFTFDIACS